MNETKYISFSPWWGGWNNQRMSYETAAAISVVTGRKLILPYKEYCLFFGSHQKKNQFLDFWRILDKNAFTSQFDCVDFFDVPEYENLGNSTHYFHGIEKIAKCYTFQNKEYNDWGHNIDPSWNEIMVNDIIDKKHFDYFSNGREIINLDVPDKYIHFPRNLFAHYYYHVYGATKEIRNTIKAKIRDGIRFRKEYYGLAKKALKTLGRYNALHVRVNDFKNTHHHETEDLVNNLVSKLEGRVSKDLPLYIATDEKDKSVFDSMRYTYNVFFLEDFYDFLDDYEALALDHIIPSNAEIFLGSMFSTFTDGINCFRGFSGKKDYSREGINFDYGKLDPNILPWRQEQYSWHHQYDTHWKFE